MKIFNKITIIGVGLIGGSIGLAVKKRHLADVVCGVGRRVSSLKMAKAKGAVDIATLDLETSIKGADLVIIATPISLIPQYALKIVTLSHMMRKGLIITDVGSTKAFIVSKLEAILPKWIHFVGGHPFAGSEKNGVVNSSADLFVGAKTFLTPTRKTDKSALANLRRFWMAIGSEVVIISPKKHDKLVAALSHGPHITAAALVNSIDKKDIKFASMGFLDTTRIAAGDPLMWRDICLSNPDNIVKAIKKLEKKLTALSKAIRDKDTKVLMQHLEAAKEDREKIK
jgi:prephenate dehydrogenase